MGITSFTIQLLNKHIPNNAAVIELGAQNIYDSGYPAGSYAHSWYQMKGCSYTCIDLSGENNAELVDLSQAFSPTKDFDVVTDFGTSEHVSSTNQRGAIDWQASYNCWHTKHKLLRTNGLMFNENPKTGNWPGHGFVYYTKEFYEQLANLTGYQIVELGEHPAMGNEESGWNVYCVLKKTPSTKWIKLQEFKKLALTPH